MTTEALELLLRAFSKYRAEWHTQDFDPFFIVPPYFGDLCSPGCSILVGGRGTGKTTALKALHYDASVSPLRRLESTAPDYVGFYVRVNKNRMPAFDDPALGSRRNRAFLHYVNLLISLEFATYLETKAADLGQALSCRAKTVFSRVLGLPISGPSCPLSELLFSAIDGLELFINNPDRCPAPTFSMAETPIRAFAETLSRYQSLTNKNFLICLDEYENFLDWQQGLFNTYIKHAEPPISYKVGVRPHGLRNRCTIDEQDLLASPADYRLIDLRREKLQAFLREVVDRRLSVCSSGVEPLTLEALLPGMTWEEEAERLGAGRAADSFLSHLEASQAEVRAWATDRNAAEIALAGFWAQATSAPPETIIREAMANPRGWSNRITNYGQPMLFWLSRGRKGARVRKYYCGSSVYLALAAQNVRFMLELLHEAIKRAASTDSPAHSLRVSPEDQTEAARSVAHRRLDALEGIPPNGTQLKRLILGLGKLFFELARSPIGRAPECTSFIVSGQPAEVEEVTKLLRDGVAHLALEEWPRTKATVPTEIRDSEYRVHPVLIPFFEFSHRKKRRIVIDASLLRDLPNRPTEVLCKILSPQQQTLVDELPDQLKLFTDFFSPGNANV